MRIRLPCGHSPALWRWLLPTGQAFAREGQQTESREGMGRMERATGVEPASEAWEASVLPMNYARASLKDGLSLAEEHIRFASRDAPGHRGTPMLAA